MPRLIGRFFFMQADGFSHVRVVTPTLGESPFLAQTVDSIAKVAPDCLHVMAAPASKVDELQRRFPKVLVVEDGGRAGGMYGAINAGLRAAGRSFEVWTYLNDDDLLRPGFAQICRKTGLREVRYGDVNLIDAEGNHLSWITRWRRKQLPRGILAARRSPLNQQGTAFGRDVFVDLDGFDERLRYASDFDFFSRCARGGIPLIPEPFHVASFRCHRGQLSLESTHFDREIADIRQQYFGDVKTWEIRAATAAFFAQNFPVYAGRLWARTPLSGRDAMRSTLSVDRRNKRP